MIAGNDRRADAGKEGGKRDVVVAGGRFSVAAGAGVRASLFTTRETSSRRLEAENDNHNANGYRLLGHRCFDSGMWI